MSTETMTAMETPTELLERVVIGGDLSKLASADRLLYYRQVCNSVGLNPLTRPFEYITLNGKLTLYAKRDATDQLRNNQSVSISITAREVVNDVYVVTAKATKGNRTDESIGAVAIRGLSGDTLANAYMKAETKAKRRVTLSICGLGMLDETEIETIPDAKPAPTVVAPAATSDAEVVDPTDEWVAAFAAVPTIKGAQGLWKDAQAHRKQFSEAGWVRVETAKDAAKARLEASHAPA